VNTTWDDVASDSGWEWASLTESAASNVPPIFTKDGRYGQFLVLFFPTQSLLGSQLLLLPCRVIC
jgi:hypothetical protein